MPSFSRSQRFILQVILFVLALGLISLALWPFNSDQQSDTKAPDVSHEPVPEQANIADSKPADKHAGLSLRDTLADGSSGPELVLISAGEFVMGSPDDEVGRYPNEQQHTVTIEQGFAIGRYEVTFEEYIVFAEASGRAVPDDQNWGRGQHPVINVSWRDALAYTEWLSQQTGQRYRLPTEAEWEYVARGGSQSAYWWGEEFKPEWVNCYGCNSKQEVSAPVPVGQFPANPFGVYDVLGNVWEFTCSNYVEEYDGSEMQCSDASDEANKSIRGGSYQNRAEVSARYSMQAEVFRPLRCAVRDKFFPEDHNDIIGFRVARDL